MNLKINPKGVYRWELRDAKTEEIVSFGEKTNVVTLSGWAALLNTNFDPSSSLTTRVEIVLSPDAMSEIETVENLTNQVRGTAVSPTVINEASAGVPKNFVYHFQFPIPITTKVWKTIGLYHNRNDRCMSITSLTSDITQLGNDTPTPQILDLYYTLYFDFDENAVISHSMKGGPVLKNFLDVFSERKISEFNCNLLLDPYATLAKTMSPKFGDYIVASAKEATTDIFLGCKMTEYGNKTAIDLVEDVSDPIFKKKASINYTNANEIGKIFGSVRIASNVSSHHSFSANDFGIYWPITQNVNVKPIQNVFSHKPDSTVPFEYSFRSTGKLVFDDTNLDLSVLPSWYQINYIGSGNASDENVRFSVKRCDFLGMPGNTYFPDIYYNYDNQDESYSQNSANSVSFVYPNCLPDCENISDMRFCYSLYNQKEVLWFGSSYVVKQNLINADYSMLKNGQTVGFSATNIQQLAIVEPVGSQRVIFIACRNTGIWRVGEDFANVLSCDVSSISGVENKCYGIHVGYGNRVWALMAGGLVYSDDLGNTWLSSTFNLNGVSDSNWDKVKKLYAGSGTNRNVLLFVVDGGDEFCDYIWYIQSTNTTGLTIRGTGFKDSNGPKQIAAVSGWDCFLAKGHDTNNFLLFSYNVAYPSQSVALAPNAIDTLLDKNGNFFVVHREVDYRGWIGVSDSFGKCRLSVLAGTSLTQYNDPNNYKSFALMSKKGPIVFQANSRYLNPRLAGRLIDPNNYKSRVLDLIYDDWRCNPASSTLVSGFTYMAKDLTTNNFDGMRLNFAVEDIMFKGGSSISLKPHVNQIRAKLVASNQCTVAMTVRPTEILTSGFNPLVYISSILSFLFDLNKEGKTTSAFSIQINPTICLTGFSATNAENTHIFTQNEVSGTRVFDVAKTNRVILTITPNSIKMFVNGAQLGLECVSCVGMDFSKLSDIIIGQSFIRSFGFKGYIDFIQIWDKVFAPEDIAFDYLNNNYMNVTASSTFNPNSSLNDTNLLVHYKLVNQILTEMETKTMNPTSVFDFNHGLKLKFEDNSNIATSFFDKDFYTFGVVDGMLKDNQIVFGEDYYLTFVR